MWLRTLLRQKQHAEYSSFARRIQNVTTFQLFCQNGEWVTSPDNQAKRKWLA
jgi:hypothetical protein